MSKVNGIIDKYLGKSGNDNVLLEGFLGGVMDIVKASNYLKKEITKLPGKYSQEEMKNNDEAKNEIFNILATSVKMIQDKDQQTSFFNGMVKEFSKNFNISERDITKKIRSYM